LNGAGLPIPDVRPPNHPWKPIENLNQNLATITFYYGDSKAPIIPIRDVSNKNDPKRDPNIETSTYGLFSICCQDQRKSIVEKGICTQFFCTTRENGIRVLTGYYHPAYYCEMDMKDDYAIAAGSARFVSPGFALNDLVDFFERFHINRFFRRWKYIQDPKVIRQLRLLINTAPDATADHISEIRRLESYSLKTHGNMYVDRVEGLSWDYAGKLMRKRGII
jgi:hypothetical protein